MKKIFLIGLFALGTPTFYAQTAKAVNEATIYVRSTGIEQQFDMMKEQYERVLKEDKKAEFNKEFALLKSEFVETIAKAMANSYSEKELADANKKTAETGKFFQLPASKNDEELNKKAIEGRDKFLAGTQSLVIKYGDQEKLKAMQAAQSQQMEEVEPTDN